MEAEKDKRTVFVELVAATAGYSVPRDVTESDFINHFATLKRQIEEISSIRGRDAAHAFVKFQTPEAASEAIASYNGTHLRGRYKIIVRPYRNEGSYSPATSADTRQSGKHEQPRQQHPLVGSPVTRKSSLKQENVQHKQHQTSQPKVHPRRGRAPTSTNPQISHQPPRQVSSADTSSKFDAVTMQQKKSSDMDNSTAQQKKSSDMDNSTAQQKKSLAMDNSAAQSLAADYAVKQVSSIKADSQDSCPWPDIASKPIFLTEPDDGMLSEPDSSRRPSLKDLLLNPASSATDKQIQGTLSNEQSHQFPVPLASAGLTSSHPSSSPTFITVAITNLSTEADEDDLIPFLGPTGKLVKLALVNDDSSKAATVAYPSLADAQKAVMKWHGSVIYGLPVSVEVIQVVTQIPSQTPSHPPPPPGFLPGMLPSPFEPIKYPHLYPSYPAYSFPPQPADIMALMPPTLGTLNPPYMSYSMMQPQHNFARMPPPVNYPTLMPQSVDSLPTMQPITGMPRVQRKSVQRLISLRLYEFTKTTTEGKDFERNGGSLQYSDGCLLISADRLETAEMFANRVVDRLCEHQLPLSLKQLTQLAECKPNRPSLFDELCSPFTTNPNVKIVLSVEYGQGKEPAVTFVGLTEAVNSAYMHFTGSLLKEFEMNK